MKSKTRLGKGLQALIPDTEAEEFRPDRPVKVGELDVALIEPNPHQPRVVFDEESFNELKESIKEKGIIQPIVVRPINDGRYQVIAGERRLRAAIELGLKTVPVYIKRVDTDEDMLELALIENVQREHLNPIDLALGYQRLIEECHLTQEEVAKKIGKNRATVANVIRLLKLPPKIQESIRNGEITEGHARALLAIDDPAVQESIWRQTIKQKLSVRKVEQLVKKYQAEGNKQELPKKIRKPAIISRWEARLREKFGTQVKIRTRKEGGTIEIVYYSSEDFERLIEIFEQIKS